MHSQALIDAIRSENYPLRIYQAFNDNNQVIPLTASLIKFVSDIYRSIEPGHFEGQIVMFASIDDQDILPQDEGEVLYDKSILTTNTSNVLVLQMYSDNLSLPRLWQNVNTDAITNSDRAIVYSYQNKDEFFMANGQKIEIKNSFNSASIYALQYQQLEMCLQTYKEEVLHSSCVVFRECWDDPSTRILFKNAPEDKMQESLEQHLRKAIRGIDVVREYNIGASKPVDVRVYWTEANREALIELKWLGKSINEKRSITATYSDARANEGAKQLKEYLDKVQQDTPTCISKGYLAVVDGRRYGTKPDTVSITRNHGLYYRDRDVVYADEHKYYDTMNNYEKPIRFFTEPVCID